MTRGPRKPWTPHGTCHHKIYNLSCSEWERLLARACGACESCGTPPGRLVIDHDHTRARLRKPYVRGLLCMPCNRQLGMVDVGEREPTPWQVLYLATPWWAETEAVA